MFLENSLDAHIHDRAFNAGPPAHHADGSPPLSHIQHHLVGHLAGIGGDLLLRYPMISCKSEYFHPRECCIDSLLAEAISQSDLLEAAETS